MGTKETTKASHQEMFDRARHEDHSKRACHSFDNDKFICYNLINGKAKIAESTNTLAYSSSSPGPDRGKSSHCIPLGLQRSLTHVSHPGPPSLGTGGRPDQVLGAVVRPLGHDSPESTEATEGHSIVKLAEAKSIAERVIAALSPHCDRIEIAGSIRREKPVVHDIDVVLIPKPEEELLFNAALCRLGSMEVDGPKLKRIRLPENISVDIYLADPSTWAILLLIRTGSAESNVRLSSLARSKGWRLKASGEGLFDEDGTRIAGDTEKSIYEALGMQYQEPNERG